MKTKKRGILLFPLTFLASALVQFVYFAYLANQFVEYSKQLYLKVVPSDSIFPLFARDVDELMIGYLTSNSMIDKSYAILSSGIYWEMTVYTFIILVVLSYLVGLVLKWRRGR